MHAWNWRQKSRSRQQRIRKLSAGFSWQWNYFWILLILALGSQNMTRALWFSVVSIPVSIWINCWDAELALPEFQTCKWMWLRFPLKKSLSIPASFTFWILVLSRVFLRRTSRIILTVPFIQPWSSKVTPLIIKWATTNHLTITSCSTLARSPLLYPMLMQLPAIVIANVFWASRSTKISTFSVICSCKIFFFTKTLQSWPFRLHRLSTLLRLTSLAHRCDATLDCIFWNSIVIQNRIFLFTSRKK